MECRMRKVEVEAVKTWRAVRREGRRVDIGGVGEGWDMVVEEMEWSLWSPRSKRDLRV